MSDGFPLAQALAGMVSDLLRGYERQQRLNLQLHEAMIEFDLDRFLEARERTVAKPPPGPLDWMPGD
jgi:hypothetical protein